jgi:cytochrome b6-f complex iron-sulfur subunit
MDITFKGLKEKLIPDGTDKPGTSSDNLTRRNFLKIGLGALSLIATLEVGGVTFQFLRSRSLEGEFGGAITAGEEADFTPGTVTEFPDGNFYLVRAEDGGFLAIYARCPHLGCSVNWVEEKERFYCPCHASSFDFYGNFENQPVPRALDTFSVRFDGTQVVVDTAKIQQRDVFSAEQLAYL